MQEFYQHKIHRLELGTTKWQKILWGLEFRLPLMNAAGMFKEGEGYDLIVNQGAGGYIGGTSTYNQRDGNIKLGVKHPFLTLPKSGISLNFLGLPNSGDTVLSKHRLTNNKLANCPIGWSLMRSPDYSIHEAMEKLVHSLWLYHDKAEIDFIEINESCPNITSTQSADNITGLNLLENRLYYLSSHFLNKRKRNLPVILKLSNDLAINQLPKLLDTVFACKFDGLNLGNTSTSYHQVNFSNKHEKNLFDYFTKNIGGGIGGSVLKQNSLKLANAAVDYKEKHNPGYEFHVIRTGGISSLQDIIDSESAGVSLNQWYTGYFENYIKYGDMLYAKLFKL